MLLIFIFNQGGENVSQKSKDTNNSQAKPKVRFYVPAEMFCIFNLSCGKTLSSRPNNVNFIVENDKLRKQALLNNEVEATSKRLFRQSHSSSIYNDFILSCAGSKITHLLSKEQRSAYDKCLNYMKETRLSGNFSHYIVDFLVATNDKFLHLSEEEIVKNIAIRYLINSRSALSGLSNPRQEKTVYTSIPKAFSPLFFKKIEFASSVFSKNILRKDFEECLLYGFIEQIKNSTHKVLHSKNHDEMQMWIIELFNNMENNWWIPQNLNCKFKQIRMYFSNSINIDTTFMEFLAFNYIASVSNYGKNDDILKQLTPAVIYEGLQNQLIAMIKSSTHKSKRGFNLLDCTPAKNEFMYKEIINTVNKLVSMNIAKLNRPRFLRLSSRYNISRAKQLNNEMFNIA